jgi:hypothetical protein
VYDLSAFPEEIAAFATDQFEDFLVVEGRSMCKEMQGNRDVCLDEDELRLPTTVSGQALRRLLCQKITDIECEVRNGERDDFSRGELNRLYDQALSLEPKVNRDDDTGDSPVETAFGVLEDLREHLNQQGLEDEATRINTAHAMLQQFEDELPDAGDDTAPGLVDTVSSTPVSVGEAGDYMVPLEIDGLLNGTLAVDFFHDQPQLVIHRETHDIEIEDHERSTTVKFQRMSVSDDDDRGSEK